MHRHPSFKKFLLLVPCLSQILFFQIGKFDGTPEGTFLAAAEELTRDPRAAATSTFSILTKATRELLLAACMYISKP